MALMFQKRQLAKASWDGDLATVQSLVKSHPKILNEPINPNGQTALYIASSKNHPTIVQFLVSIPQIAINVEDKDGWTPLSAASRNGHALVVDILMKHPQVHLNHQDKNGKTPLYLACYYGYVEAVRLLLTNPTVDVSLKDNWDLTAHDICCDWMDDKREKPVLQQLIEDFEIRTKGQVSQVHKPFDPSDLPNFEEFEEK